VPDADRFERSTNEAFAGLLNWLESSQLAVDYNRTQIQLNFQPWVDRMKHDFELNRRFLTGDMSVLEDYQHGELNLEIAIETGDSSDAQRLAACIVYDLFLILNIVAPGSANFRSSAIRSNPPSFRSAGSEIFEPIDLNSRPFEALWHHRSRQSWLPYFDLDYEQTHRWYRSCIQPGAMIPRNPSSKALFSLFYLSSSEISPAASAFVFNALESLFDCKPGENFRSLVNRISSLLQLDESQSKSLRSALRKVYDQRSSFVHGGMKIVHPLRDDGLDDSINEDYWSDAFSFEIGAAILVCCLRELVRRSWSSPVFTETISGLPLR
jgi:hypothetical protein